MTFLSWGHLSQFWYRFVALLSLTWTMASESIALYIWLRYKGSRKKVFGSKNLKNFFGFFDFFRILWCYSGGTKCTSIGLRCGASNKAELIDIWENFNVKIFRLVLGRGKKIFYGTIFFRSSDREFKTESGNVIKSLIHP